MSLNYFPHSIHKLGKRSLKRLTLAAFRASIPALPPLWFVAGVKIVLASLPHFLRMCWLKTISGGWCTSVRLHSVKDRPCIFGCTGSKDMLSHYLVCPVLWQLARESLHLPEPSLFVEHRLCLCEPTVDKLRMLAFCHCLYHACVNDTECMKSDGLPCTGQVVQLRACELARHCIHLVGGG